jgi:hypothetical protein
VPWNLRSGPVSIQAALMSWVLQSAPTPSMPTCRSSTAEGEQVEVAVHPAELLGRLDHPGGAPAKRHLPSRQRLTLREWPHNNSNEGDGDLVPAAVNSTYQPLQARQDSVRRNNTATDLTRSPSMVTSANT